MKSGEVLKVQNEVKRTRER